MFPKFLKPFEKELTNYKREAIKIIASPEKEDNYKDKLQLKQSKFLGTPFFPIDKSYPLDQKGSPMIMIAQINFSECPKLSNLPNEGILQLFISNDGWYMDDAKIIYHNVDDLGKEAIPDFEFLEKVSFEDMPIYKVHSLEFKKIIEYGGSEDSQFDFDFNGEDYWDFYEGLDDNEKKEMLEFLGANGHKIGGYADFTQSDPRDYESNKRDDFQLLQLDTDEEIMFGDSGVAHIFISPDSLINKEFNKAYFYWDCC